MKAKLLRPAGRIEDGSAVDIVARSEKRDDSQAAEGRRTAEYAVRDDAGHEESVATKDPQVER